MSAKNPDSWLSAVIPNFNDDKLLPRAVRALAQQQPAPDEIIIVDDGSTDESLQVIDGLLKDIPILRLIRHEENLGVIPALNRGINESTGRLVYLGSANDWVNQGFFDCVRSMYERYPDAAFYSAECRIVDTSGKYLAVRPPALPSKVEKFIPAENVLRLFRRIDNFAPSPTVVFNRSKVLDEGALQEELGSFADGYLVRSLAVTHGFCFSPIIGANWTMNPTSVSQTTAGSPELALEIMKRAVGHMRNNNGFPRSYPARFERRWRFGLGRVISGADMKTLWAMGAIVAPGALDKGIWQMLTLIPSKPGKYLRLAWLVLRFRPFSPAAIIRTWIWRRRRPIEHS